MDLLSNLKLFDFSYYSMQNLHAKKVISNGKVRSLRMTMSPICCQMLEGAFLLPLRQLYSFTAYVPKLPFHRCIIIDPLKHGLVIIDMSMVHSIS